MREIAVIAAAAATIAGLVLLERFEPPVAYTAGAAALLVSVALVGQASGLSLRRLSVPSVWYYSFLASTAVPAYIVVLGVDTPYVAPFLVAVLLTLITAPVGMLLVNLATGYRPEETAAFFHAPLEGTRPGPSEAGAYLMLLVACLALTAGYLIETPVIPLLDLIRSPGSAVMLVTLREESFKLLESRFVYLYDVIRNVVYPFLIALALAVYLASRRPLWLWLFLLTAGAGLFYAAVTIAKAPVAVIVLVIVLLAYLYRGGQVSLRAAAAGMLAVFLFPVAVLYQSLSGLGVKAADIALAIVRRLFYLPAEILYNYFVIVPDVVPHLHGRTIGRIQWILGETDVDIGNFVFRYMYPWRIDTGVANTSFLGYAHADFGLPGVLVYGVLVGVLVQTIQVWLTRRGKTPATLAAYAFLLWAAWKINLQALPQTLLSGGILIIIFLVGFLRVAESFLDMATSRPARRAARA